MACDLFYYFINLTFRPFYVFVKYYLCSCKKAKKYSTRYNTKIANLRSLYHFSSCHLKSRLTMPPLRVVVFRDRKAFHLFMIVHHVLFFCWRKRVIFFSISFYYFKRTSIYVKYIYISTYIKLSTFCR